MQHSPGRAGLDAAAAFADPAFAALRQSGAPFVVVRPAMDQVVWANAAAAAHFGSAAPDELARVLLGRGGWLEGLTVGLPPDRPPRLARAGLARGFGMRAHTAVIRAWTDEGGDLLGFAVPDAAPPVAGDRDGWLRPAWPDAEPPSAEADPAPQDDPDAGPALARRSQVAVLRDRLSRALDGSTTLRLLWRWHVDGVAVPADSGLLARLGVPLDFAAAPMVDLLSPFDGTGAERLAAALSARRTWSGVTVGLPVADGIASAPLSLAASPSFGPDRTFAGFLGFGTLDLGRLDVAARPAADALPSAEPEAAGLVGASPDIQPSAEPEPAVDGERGSGGDSMPAGRAADTIPEPGALGANIVHLRAFQAALPGRTAAAPSGSRGSGEDLSSEPGATEDRDGAGGHAAPLSDDLAFQALGEALRARIGASVRPSAADERPSEPAIETEADASEARSEPPASEIGPSTSGLLDQLPVPVVAVADRAVVYANLAAASLLGYASPEAMLAIGPDLMDPASDPLTLRDADGASVEHAARCASASWAGAPVALYAFVPADPAPAREPAGRERDARAGELLDRVDDAVALLDGNGRLRRLNRRGEGWFGPVGGGAPGPIFTQLLAPESRPKALALLGEVRDARDAASGPPSSRDVLALAGEGAPVPMLLTLGRLGASGFYLTLRDVTALKRAEGERGRSERDSNAHDTAPDRAREAGRSSALLSKVNHEIRTPLSAILGFAEVMMDERFGPLGNPRYKDYLKDIHASGTQVVALVEDLLDLSRIEAGQLDLAVAPLDVNRIVSETVTEMQAEAHRARVIMRTSLAGRLPFALADERSARQIVRNLLSNAVKFNEPGGQVIVSTASSDAGTVLLRVRDTGVGMTEGEIAAALEPFGEAATADPAEGNGLGLPLTRALAGANGASIAIQSRPREGTLVEVAFAAAGPEEARSAG